MDTVTVAIVDDHPLFRQGVANTLSLEPGFTVLGQAANGETGLELIRRCRPQVAVVDVNLPKMNGHQLTRQVAAEKIPTKIVLMTAYDDAAQTVHAVQVGAWAYCNKEVRPEQLVDTLRRVAAGQIILGDERLEPEQLAYWLAMQAEAITLPHRDPAGLFEPLTGREMAVLNYLTQGMSNKEIAGMLGISPETVKNHVTAVLRKLGVDDRTKAAILALRLGWARLYPQVLQSEE